MISYQTIYWIVALVIFLWFNAQENSFDNGYDWRGFFPVRRILHSLVMFKWVTHSTFVSRFRVSVLLYLLSWVLWFIIF